MLGGVAQGDVDVCFLKSHLVDVYMIFIKVANCRFVDCQKIETTIDVYVTNKIFGVETCFVKFKSVEFYFFLNQR